VDGWQHHLKGRKLEKLAGERGVFCSTGDKRLGGKGLFCGDGGGGGAANKEEGEGTFPKERAAGG